jgi:putative transposase
LLKAYKFRLYSHVEQAVFFAKTFGCVRWYYNQALADCIKEYKETGKFNITYPAYYKKEKAWLKELDSFALCNAERQLETTYKNFFEGLKRGKKVGFPQFRKKGYNDRYTTNNNAGQIRIIRIEGTSLRLPKIGLVPCVFSRFVRGKIKSVTVKRVASGKLYAGILTEDKEGKHDVKVDTEKAVGIDMSMKDFAVTSDGERANYPRYYRKSEKKVPTLQRKLARHC